MKATESEITAKLAMARVTARPQADRQVAILGADIEVTTIKVSHIIAFSLRDNFMNRGFEND